MTPAVSAAQARGQADAILRESRTYLEGGRHGAGFGKRAMGIRVIDVDTGAPIGYPRAFVRWISQILSGLVILLGYFWMLWDPEKQCWHDKFAGDVVVPTAQYPVPAQS